MGIIEDAIVKAKDVADVAGKKTGEALELTRLRINATELGNKIEKIYLDLGKKVYAAAKAEEDCTDFVNLKIEEIDKIKAEIERVEVKISELKNEKKCPECGAFNTRDSIYCKKCSAKL